MTFAIPTLLLSCAAIICIMLDTPSIPVQKQSLHNISLAATLVSEETLLIFLSYANIYHSYFMGFTAETNKN